MHVVLDERWEEGGKKKKKKKGRAGCRATLSGYTACMAHVLERARIYAHAFLTLPTMLLKIK